MKDESQIMFSEPLEKAHEFSVQLNDTEAMLAQYQLDKKRFEILLANSSLSNQDRSRLETIYKTCEELVKKTELQKAQLRKDLQLLYQQHDQMQQMLRDFNPKTSH